MDSMRRNRSWTDVKDVVMGLRWAPPPDQRHSLEPANLDAMCVSLDARGRRLDMVYPGRPTNANGSVIHTGDSRRGESSWDDERVFVFLDAVPRAVHALVFGVVSSNGWPFCDVPGASCHLSEYMMEDELLSVELTALGPLKAYCVATLQRGPSGWTMEEGAPGGTIVPELLSAGAGGGL